jgi:hypothetical protein
MAKNGRPHMAAFFVERIEGWSLRVTMRLIETAEGKLSRVLNLGVRFAMVAALAGGFAAVAIPASAQLAPMAAGAVSSNASPADNDYVGQVREHQGWEFGPFANGGTGLGNRDDYKFFSLGVEGGKIMTPVIHAGILTGQFQYAANLMPFWQAYTPPPHEQIFKYPGGYFVAPEGGGTFTGASFTPVILRWNFLTRSRRFQPWFQGAGGLIYTTHKFPPDALVPHGTPGGTSVFNFTPQGGIGAHYFIRRGRSIDLGINAVHISSASLGDRNPGVNASVQFQLGYTFWR